MNSGISAFALARVLGARVAWRYGEKLPSLMQRRSLDDPRAASSRSLRSQDNDSPRRQRRSQDEAPPTAPRQRRSQDEAPSPHRESHHHHHHHHHGAQDDSSFVPLGRWNRIASMRGLYNAPVAAEVEAPAAAAPPIAAPAATEGDGLTAPLLVVIGDDAEGEGAGADEGADAASDASSECSSSASSSDDGLPPPDSTAMAVVGMGLIWFGWFGFNGGSAIAADADAVIAVTNTQLATGASLCAWCLLERCVALSIPWSLGRWRPSLSSRRELR